MLNVGLRGILMGSAYIRIYLRNYPLTDAQKNIIGCALRLKIRIARRQNIFVSRSDFLSTIFDKSACDSVIV